MGFRFWRRITLAPGISLNLSKSGASVSFGPRGAKLTIGPRGKRTTVGIPGTGLFYTETIPPKNKKKGKRSSEVVPAEPVVPLEARLSLGFFKRLITPKDEEAFVDGCREMVLGHEDKALEFLRNAGHIADAAFLAGLLALKAGRLSEADRFLKLAAQRQEELGTYFARYGMDATMSIAITEEISAHVGPDIRGVLLAQVEIYQRQKRWQDAVICLKKLRRLEPDDPVIMLSLAELLLDVPQPHTKTPRRKGQPQRNACKLVIEMTEGVENETPVHAALLLYKARALRWLGLPAAARDTLTSALRRKKDRSQELMMALRYERVLAYDALGQKKRARAELEKLYAEAPGYEDVKKRLGL